jgi:hypothetical protein
MALFYVHRYLVKRPDGVFIDRASLNESEMQIYDDYINLFVNSLDGNKGSPVVRTNIDDNTIKLTIELDSPNGKEQLFAENYMRSLGTSNNQYRVAYLNMLKNKGENINISKCYWEVEYANNHVQMYKFSPNS